MLATKSYSVKEFGKLAGVSVRTLHFYDETGLLKPSLRTEAGHRVYKRDDLLRLQQIVTLKYLGFSLTEIQKLLDSPVYDLERSLRIQKDAIDQRIQQLQQASRALEQTLARFSETVPEEMDWQLINQIIKGVMYEEHAHWFQQYFTPDQLSELQQRGQYRSREEMEQGQRQWAEVIAGFQDNSHLPPDHPIIQALTEQMLGLVREFTQGNPGLGKALKKMYDNLDKMPLSLQPYDSDLKVFMDKAVIIYQQRHPDFRVGID